MSYTNPDTMMEVANILESFDEKNLRDIFKAQIISNDDYTGIQINHLAPLYSSYQRALKIEDVDEDDIMQIRIKFQNICIMVIEFICSKFNIEVDSNWIEMNLNKLPAITMCLYQFFILDIFNIILKSLENYICTNTNALYEVFSGNSEFKDVSTVTNMKTMDPMWATLASSMYDVTDYVFSMMDSEEFLSSLGLEYTPKLVMEEMMNQGYLSGDFENTFANIYKDNLALRSKISFELIYKIKEQGYLYFNPLIIPAEQIISNNNPTSEESKYHQNTDITDDVG